MPIVLAVTVFSHNLVPRAETIGLEYEYYIIVHTKGSQRLLCNLASYCRIFFSPTPHSWSLWLPRPETGSLRINCGLISYLISKQVQVNTFRASYILSNLQERETSRFLERSCLLIACIQAWLSHCLPLEKPPTKKGFII